MDLFKILETKFKTIDAKLASKTALINSCYSKEIANINQIFNASIQKAYENGLNLGRDEMLSEVILKRDEQLKKANNQTKNILAESLKFSRSLISVYESILYRTQLENQFNFAHLVKYSIFLRKEEISLANLNHLIVQKQVYYNDEYEFYILPANKILLCYYITLGEAAEQINMMILDRKGDLIQFKQIKKEEMENCYLFPFKFYVNATNIIVFQNEASIVNVYDFGLELVGSFKLDKCYSSDLKLNNYEIAFYDGAEFTVNIYSYKTARLIKNVIQLKDKVEVGNDYIKIEFNDKFVFIKGPSTLFILNRKDNNKLFKCFELFRTLDWFIFNEEVCIRDYENYSKIIFFDSNSANKIDSVYEKYFSYNLDGENFYRVYSTSNRKYIYAKEIYVNALNRRILRFGAY